MDTIGSDCWKLINEYKYQLEHSKKFLSTLFILSPELCFDKTGSWTIGMKKERIWDIHIDIHNRTIDISACKFCGVVGEDMNCYTCEDCNVLRNILGRYESFINHKKGSEKKIKKYEKYLASHSDFYQKYNDDLFSCFCKNYDDKCYYFWD